MTIKPTIACAVYTRKSTEEGLDQAFNSLDAQYEACAAFVASQKHEGWKLHKGRYDDGGISGGTLERDGLQRLLADVDAGLVRMIVVYKIDRLTRSLADFARLIERLDKAGCSFVSVTQAFNTSTSMGRLTLNVLLSFAQFEREVTAERIRDKIAASKAKGLWMGGFPPLGYDRHPDANTRSLVINAQEAEQVRHVFRLFEAHGRLGAVEREARLLGIRSKYHAFANGKSRGGNFMSRGQVQSLLSNPIYAGLIRHKEKIHEGLHEAIIEPERWQEVQTRLQANARKPRKTKGFVEATIRSDSNKTGSPSIKSLNHSDCTSEHKADGQTTHEQSSMIHKPALLQGLLFDDRGSRFTPTHCKKGDRRYYYYVTVNKRKTHEGNDRSSNSQSRLPADQINELVMDAIRGQFSEPTHQMALLQAPHLEAIETNGQACVRLLNDLEENPQILRSLVKRILLGEQNLTIELDRDGLASCLDLDTSQIIAEPLTITTKVSRRRRGVETRLLVPGNVKSRPDKTLIRTLALSHQWLAMIKANQSLEEIAHSAKLSVTQIRTRMPFALLSPTIQKAILNGTQPPDLTADKIARTRLPIDWQEQEDVLGF